jgi:hypothetical protein
MIKVYCGVSAIVGMLFMDLQGQEALANNLRVTNGVMSAGDKVGFNTVDFRYALPWWQTAICLPDDPEKGVVGKEGQFFFDFRVANKGKGPRKFSFSIAPQIEGESRWIRQETVSAKAPIVRTWWDNNGVEVLSESFLLIPAAFTGGLPKIEDIITGAADKSAYAQFKPSSQFPSRSYASLIHLRNPGSNAQNRRPVIRVESAIPVQFDKGNGVVTVGGVTKILASTPIESCQQEGKEWVIRLVAQEIPSGQSRDVAITVLRNSNSAAKALSTTEVKAERDRAIQWWESRKLPWDIIQVPDQGMQGMLQSSVRNIWQAREIKNGLPAFQVGPTVYRSLWIVDGAFLLEAATMLGAGDQARAGIAYELSHQKEDGGIEVMLDKYGYWKENGIVLWTCIRHAQLMQDKVWLESNWPKFQRIASFIKALRTDDPVASKDRATVPAKHTLLDKGLMPHGIIDGGIQNGIDYSNTYWNLIGLRSFIEAAKWLGENDEANVWQKEYDDFMAVFRTAAARDMTNDPHGNRYLPILMGDDGKKQLPQRGQWSFLHSVYPGQLFAKDEALVGGNLSMLRATKQQGLIFGTGWDAAGIWTYAASFYGHALLWQGSGQEAAQVLYDFANHAVPTRVWREEQRPVGKGGNEVGDMPHNWASAEFIRLTAHLIELDRGNELHLLEGLPPEWTGPGMETRLNGIATPFGPLTLSLKVSSDGTNASLSFAPLAENCLGVVVHLPDGSTRRLPAQQAGAMTFPVRRR